MLLKVFIALQFACTSYIRITFIKRNDEPVWFKILLDMKVQKDS